MKERMNQYLYLHWNVYLLTGRLSSLYYKKMMSDLIELNIQSNQSKFKFPVTKLYPCYLDDTDTAGSARTHYFIQDLYVAQRVFRNNPVRHIDVGSRVDGFVAHIASFRTIEVFDIRPLDEKIPNVIFTQMDLMDKKRIGLEIADSISCLHALEHFGLGRYGDPVNYDGFYIGFKNLTQMLKRGGRLYLSLPLGKQRIEFHAHRVFSLAFLIELICDDYDISIFSYIDDANKLHENVSITTQSLVDNFGCNFGCAVFELIKK